MKNLIENFTTIRRNKGYSQEYVAKRLGISQQSLSHKLTSQKDVKLAFFVALCEAIDCSVIDVIAYPDHYVPESSIPEDVGCQDCKKKDLTIQNLNSYIIRLEHERDELAERVRGMEVK